MTPDATSTPSYATAELSANYRPGQPRVRYRKSVDHTLRHGVRSMMLSVARRPDFDVPDLATLATTVEVVDLALHMAVDNLRGQGHSWQVIGDALGITRQTAHERFGKVTPRTTAAAGRRRQHLASSPQRGGKNSH